MGDMMSTYTGLTALLGLTSVFTVSFGPNFENDPRGAGFLVMFVVLVLLSGWVANSLAARRVKR